VSQHAEPTQSAFEATAAETPRQHVERTAPRFIWTGMVVSYVVVVTPIVAIYFLVKGHF
jgi:hypothetical protein